MCIDNIVVVYLLAYIVVGFFVSSIFVYLGKDSMDNIVQHLCFLTMGITAWPVVSILICINMREWWVARKIKKSGYEED